MRRLDRPSRECRSSPLYPAARSTWAILRSALELEKYLPAADDEPVESDSTGMCAWKDCECFFIRPVHLMRVCNGCYMVFYCNKKCQKAYVFLFWISSVVMRLLMWFYALLLVIGMMDTRNIVRACSKGDDRLSHVY